MYRPCYRRGKRENASSQKLRSFQNPQNIHQIKHTIMNSSHRAPRGLLRENAPTHLSLQLHSLRSYLSSGFRPAGRKSSNVIQMQAAFKHLQNMLI